MVLRARRHLRLASLALLPPALLVAAACGGGSSDHSPGSGITPGYIPPLVATSMAGGTATPAPAAPDAPTATPRAGNDEFMTGPIEATPFDVPPDARAAVDAVIAEVVRRLDVAEEDITVINVEARDWSDSCLDVVYTNQQEPCAQVITPGYNVTVYFGDTVESWHTDENGSIVRFANQQIVQN